MPKSTLVLVHGACHGPDCWYALRSRLEADGHEVTTVDLPSSGTDVAHLGDLYADADTVRAEVDACESAVVVAHSYGGAPVTHGLAGAANVRRLVYLAAFMLAENETLGDVAAGDGDDWVVSDDGATISARDPALLFYNHCSPEVLAAALPDLVPQRELTSGQPVLRAAWRTIPSTYVVCEDDRAISPDAQRRMALRASATHVLASDHSPFLSHPDATAALLETIAFD